MDSRRLKTPLIAALASFAAFYALSVYSLAEAVLAESPGFVFFENIGFEPSKLGAAAITTPAAEATEGLQGLLHVLSIDGVDPATLPGRGALPVRAWRFTRRGEAPAHTFELRDERGVTRTVTVPTSTPALSALPSVFFLGLAYALVGLFYLAVGLGVWLRRPSDPAAPWMLGLGIIAATHLAQSAPDHPLGWWLNIAAGSMMPLYGPAAIGLVRGFTSVPLTDHLRRVRRGVEVAALVLVAALPAGYVLWASGAYGSWPLRTALVLIGLELGASIAVFFWVARRATSSEHPPAVRRRARLLTIAVVTSFGLPTLELIVLPFLDHPPVELIVPNLVCLAAFPIAIGYAILRYQAFDLRIVFRRGVVYAILSLTVSLAFVGVVLLLVKLIGARAESTAALWFTSMLLVVGVGILQLRVQRFVDRWVNKKRDRYAKGVQEISDALVRVNSLPELSEMARRALVEVMGLSRAYVALLDGESVDCFLLDNRVDPETGEAPPEVPAHFSLDEMPPLARARDLEQMTTAYDADALPSMEGASPLSAEFWSMYGLEVVAPLTRRGAGRRSVMGFLMLGPRIDGQPLDREDRVLLELLANQLTVAAENTLAFEQIRALKEGLEEKVKARTKELEQALEELSSAEAQIVESAKQAMLGRLVAGIVHEVNTPLGALKSSADTLQRVLTKLEGEFPIDHPAHRHLKMGKELSDLQVTTAARLSSIMSSLKSFVSLDGAELRDVDVREGIDSAIRLLGGEIADGVRIVRDYPADLPRVRAHAQRLNQVFLQVLHNAVRALGDAGRIDISVRAEASGRLSVTIRDDGPGIPKERRADLFEFGFTKKGDRVGMRLGLPSSKRTLQELGGDIRVQTEDGEGTAVHIDLPCRPPERARAPDASNARA